MDDIYKGGCLSRLIQSESKTFSDYCSALQFGILHMLLLLLLTIMHKLRKLLFQEWAAIKHGQASVGIVGELFKEQGRCLRPIDGIDAS